MVWRIMGGVFFIVLAVGYFGIVDVPRVLMGVIALVAGIALIAGV